MSRFEQTPTSQARMTRSCAWKSSMAAAVCIIPEGHKIGNTLKKFKTRQVNCKSCRCTLLRSFAGDYSVIAKKSGSETDLR